MMSRHPSLSPRNSGFIPLGKSKSNDMGDNIQLTPVKSNVSTKSTGQRMAGQELPTSFESSDTQNEKSGNGHRGRRRKLEGKLDRSDTGDEGFGLNYMGRLYNKIVGWSVVTRYLVYVLPVALVLGVPLIVIPLTGHKDDIFVGGAPAGGGDRPTLFKLFLWIMIMWLSLWIAKVAAWLLPSIFMFFCGVVSPGTRKYAQVLRNLILPFSFFFWALASWVTFTGLYRDFNGVSWTQTMERILGALFVSSAIFLAEKAIVQAIGITYHQRSFANRIKLSKRDVHLLGLLYDASRTLFPMYCPEFADEDHIINDSLELSIPGQKKAHTRTGSAAPIKLLSNVGRVGDKVTSVFGNIASEITGKEVFNPNSAHSIVVEALEKTKSSEALAKRIWLSFVVENHNTLYVEDFQEVLGPAYKNEAEEAFDAIDNDQNGDISLDEMIRKVVEIGQERKAISEGMKDIGQALRVFDKILLFVVMMIVIFVFLAFFNSSFIATLATAGTTLLSLSFIFAVTCQEFLGSCIFLFVKHPYDVGDRVDIDKMRLVVDKISLLYTVFTRIDRQQVVQVPNIVLNNTWIENISRSKAMTETLEVNVSFDTTFDDIELLRAEMEKFVRDPENSRDFQPNFTISIGGVGDLDKLLLFVGVKHKSNWHNDGVRATRRSKFMCALALALKKVPIYPPGGGSEPLGGPGNPSYSVAVSDAEAAHKRDEFGEKKEAKRMVPSRKGEAAEKQAVSGLSNRPITAEFGDDNTLGSEDQERTKDVETMRSDLRRESTRGRRKAGEAIPTTLTVGGESAPMISVSSHQRSPQHVSFDEEAETGMSPTPYHSNLTAGPTGSFYLPFPGTSGQTQTQMQHPLSRSPPQGPPPQGPPPQGPPPQGLPQGPPSAKDGQSAGQR